jgi:hypothetical protein
MEPSDGCPYRLLSSNVEGRRRGLHVFAPGCRQALGFDEAVTEDGPHPSGRAGAVAATWGAWSF